MSRISQLPPTSHLSGFWAGTLRELTLVDAEVRLTQTLEAIRTDLHGISSTQTLTIKGLLTPGMSEDQIRSIYSHAMGEISKNVTSADFVDLREREVSTPQTWDLFDTTELLAEIAMIEDRKIDPRKLVVKKEQPEQETRFRLVTNLARCLNEIGAQQRNPHLQERARYLLYLNYTIAYQHGGLYESSLQEMSELFASWQ
jgi:hypothetical protein